MRIDYQNRPATRISMNFLHFVGLLMLFFWGGMPRTKGSPRKNEPYLGILMKSWPHTHTA